MQRGTEQQQQLQYTRRHARVSAGLPATDERWGLQGEEKGAAGQQWDSGLWGVRREDY